MKKIISILLAAVMVMALLAGCGSKNSDKTNDNNTPNNNQNTELSGSVSTNGSTSMDKVIGALREQFMADHKNVTVTYDPTGSGSGIEAVKNGTADIGLASRSLKDEEKADGLTETVIALDGIAVIVNAQSKVADLTVEQIAASASISPSECLRCFHDMIGTTPNQYLRDQRAQRAAELLCGTGLRVTEIAMQCGFQDASYFARAFKKRTGETPTQYRRRVSKKIGEHHPEGVL